MSRGKVTIKTPTIEQLLVATVPQVFDYIEETLEIHGIPYIYNKDYIVTDIEGVLPLVCVHADTVSKTPPKQKDLIVKNNTISLATTSKAGCLGADDRAGVWIALQLIASRKTNKTPFNFGFFDYEESGAIGSNSFTKKYPGAIYSCFIGLDRAEKQKPNVATYGYDNSELLEVFTAEGYEESFGSFSDCSNLSRHFDVPCLNLSIGYQNEHTSRETLDITSMVNTLEVMQNIEIPAKEYEIEETIYNWRDWRSDYKTVSSYSTGEEILCDYCMQHKPLYATDDDYRLCKECLTYRQNNEGLI